MKSLGVNADWYESQQKQEVRNMKKLTDKKIMKELQLTNKEIKMRRRERLLGLYLYEIEL